MGQREHRPTAVVLLVRDGEELLLGPIYARDACDLELVDGLLRVHLSARRFGWSIRVAEVRPDLMELIDLVGLRTELVG